MIKPLWFANHRAHLHVATLVSLSKEKSFQDRLALVCSLSWNSKNNDCRWMTDVIVHSPLSYWRQNNPCNTTRDIQTTPIMTTSSTLSSIPSHSRLSRSYFYASDKEHSWIDNKESGWNRCRAHFLWEKECKRYNGKWTIYGNWRTKVFNPATAYLETTFQPMEGNNVKVSEWRELSHCLGVSFQKNPLQTRYRHGQLWRQWEIGMESLKADRLEEEVR